MKKTLIVLIAIMLGSPSFAGEKISSPFYKAALTGAYVLQAGWGGIKIVAGTGMAVAGSEAVAPIFLGGAIAIHGGCDVYSAGDNLWVVWKKGEVPDQGNCFSKVSNYAAHKLNLSPSSTQFANAAAYFADAGVNFLEGGAVLSAYNGILAPLAGAGFSTGQISAAGYVTSNITGMSAMPSVFAQHSTQPQHTASSK